MQIMTQQTFILVDVCKDQTDWAQNITPVLMAYRATVTLPTGISPHYALFGREMNLGCYDAFCRWSSAVAATAAAACPVHS